MPEGRTSRNGPDNKKANDEEQGFTSDRQHWPTMCQERRGKRLASIKDCIYVTKLDFEDNIDMSEERLITVTRNSINNISTKRTTIKKKQKKKREEKQLYGYFKRKTGEINEEDLDRAKKKKKRKL